MSNRSIGWNRWVRVAGIWYRSLEQDGEPGLQTGQQ